MTSWKTKKRLKICFTDGWSFRFRFTSFSAVELCRTQRVDRKHQAVVVVIHRVSRKVACIAKRCKSLFRHFVLALRRIGNYMSRHEVIIVEIFGERVFGVPEGFLGKWRWELKRTFSEFIDFLLTFPGWLTQIVEQPMGASIELLLSTVFGRISSMWSRNSCGVFVSKTC